MFTGIIEEVGSIKNIRKGQSSSCLEIQAHIITDDLRLGDSVSVNGVCLTVTKLNNDGFTADVMHETLNRTSFGKISVGSCVNLERAMKANMRFGGHLVTGHIDGTGKIVKIEKDDNAVWYYVLVSSELMNYIVLKGSVALEGISLTVAKVFNDKFAVSIIPHTASNTTLSQKKTGDTLNIETDIIGKYVKKFMPDTCSSSITKEFLTRNGFQGR